MRTRARWRVHGTCQVKGAALDRAFGAAIDCTVDGFIRGTLAVCPEGAKELSAEELERAIDREGARPAEIEHLRPGEVSAQRRDHALLPLLEKGHLYQSHSARVP